jgi:hypothetical protein
MAATTELFLPKIMIKIPCKYLFPSAAHVMFSYFSFFLCSSLISPPVIYVVELCVSTL